MAAKALGTKRRPAVRIAPMPPAIIDKGIASAGLLAYIVTGKFCDSLPLYRQEKQFARIGVELSRRTMADWMIAASRSVRAADEDLGGRLRSGPLLQLDETRRAGHGGARTSQHVVELYVGRTGRAARGASDSVPLRSQPRRGSGPPDAGRLSKATFRPTGMRSTTECVTERKNVVHVGCWAHVRRKFLDAQKNSKKSWQRGGGLGDDRQAVPRGETDARRTRIRRSSPPNDVGRSSRFLWSSAPGWNGEPLRFPPRHSWARRLATRWGSGPSSFATWITLPSAPTPTRVENAIRPFVVGRKNWLFSGSPRGATASATLFSIIETANANGQEPYWYLRKLFEELPTARSEAELLQLAPFRSTDA